MHFCRKLKCIYCEHTPTNIYLHVHQLNRGSVRSSDDNETIFRCLHDNEMFRQRERISKRTGRQNKQTHTRTVKRERLLHMHKQLSKYVCMCVKKERACCVYERISRDFRRAKQIMKNAIGHRTGVYIQIDTCIVTYLHNAFTVLTPRTCFMRSSA